MKFINKAFIAAGMVGALLSTAACTGDLDLTPTNPSDMTDDKFQSDPKSYMQGLIGNVYMQYATYGVNGDASVQKFDGGMSTFQRAVWLLEEASSDEGSWIPNDADYGGWQYGITPSGNTVVMGTYSRLFINIACCNQFIQTVKDGYFNSDNAEVVALAEEFVRQARILRAGSYWYAIDNFGNVPYADENVLVSQIAPQLSTDFAEGRRLVTEKVVADLEDIVSWYKTNDPTNKPPYGYVGLDVAESLLVKFYLNYQVYTGTAAWDKCFQHAEAIIQRLGTGGYDNSGLCYGYHQNFGANNKDFAIGGSSPVNEIIWVIPQSDPGLDDEGLGLKSYANSTFMCNAWIGDAPGDATYKIKKSEYNSGNGWKCIVTRPQFVEKFEWNGDFSVSPDIRTQFWKTSKDGFNMQNISLNQADYGNNGYLAVKYTNWYIDDDNKINKSQSPAATDQLYGDYAMIRLAEIYLSAAEAALNGGGDASKALIYTNYIRTRAGMPAYDNITLMELRDERARELYTECIRRSDLIRYGQWISGYTWSWKNQTPEGSDFSSNFIVYPIPNSTAGRNGYTQNPGY